MASRQYFLTRPKMLAVLQMGGAQGQVFTAEQVVYHLGKYIEKKKLYDPSNMRIIRCGSDLLGEALQVSQFFVTDFKNIWNLVSPCLIPATKQGSSSTGQGGSSTDSKHSNCSSVSTNRDFPHFPGLCNICQNNPNDATIVHGNNGHQFCCVRCAKRLRNRGKGCPVCRQPIVLVVKNFIVQF